MTRILSSGVKGLMYCTAFGETVPPVEPAVCWAGVSLTDSRKSELVVEMFRP